MIVIKIYLMLYIGLINLKYMCFRICLDFFFKWMDNLREVGIDWGINKWLFIF